MDRPGSADPGREGPADLVDQMVWRLGGESVAVAQQVLMDMNRTDVLQNLAGIRSGSTEEFQSVLFQKEASLTAMMEKLLETFEDLGEAKFEHFQRVVQKSLSRKAGRRTPAVAVETGRKLKLAELMLEQLDEQTLDMAALVLKKIHRSDLVQKISGGNPAAGPPGVTRGHEGVKLESSCWTELVPEVNQTESPTYSLQSEAGLFECSISGLRWFCSERVVFRFRFCSWDDGHMDRMESRGYRPAGPLLDISVITGRMAAVFLPHWICVDDVPEPLEHFAVLHMDHCGDAVEKVSEVSPSHVRLTEPVFSPRAVLMRAGFPVKVYCNVLLYRTNTAFLTLHVYLVPRDPALQQAMDQKETSSGYRVIQKPDPEKSLKMNEFFFLTSDLEAAEVSPKTGIKLRYPRGKPNFFEVYVENADRTFSLTLRADGQDQPVWECSVRKDEYQSSSQAQEIQSVDEHLAEMMQRAAIITSDKEMLLNLMKDLKQEELKGFKWFLKNRDVSSGCPQIPVSLLEEADASDLVDLMMNTYSRGAVLLTQDIFKKISRNDLVEMFPGTSCKRKCKNF
ncbi:NACHT, LRR and PYD domains-containing protein 1b allele 2-like [Poeciliopsis prolifica]|uniref:NACHT, LRR and PYD domains-containing protein 1b allele 2-like n=1 Tax=Poeciliopsis prolifica TaxID=188132 RepID=UPI0024146857|nr:NACHT, LRR and PYD domains-containing protein 1b allele 2-like [Poeciliopsis prolifica]